MKKLKRKSKLLIIVLVAVLALSGGAAAVILTVVFPHLSAPVLSAEAYPTGEPTYTITFMWEEVKKAFGYRVEYKYDLYPDEVHKVSVKSNSVTIYRVKGTIQIRVQTLGQRERQDSDFSHWQSYDIQPIPLGEPGVVSYTSFADETGVYYQIIPETWRSATYTYLHKTKQIEFYEVAIASSDLDEELALGETRFVSAKEFLEEQHYFPPASGTWTIYYRAINTKGDYGEFGLLPGEPIELFELFGASAWVKTQVTVM